MINYLNKKKYQKISFDLDISFNNSLLLNEINNKNILVIGGAGTIGSSYIKQILKYTPSKITVVDINENGLTELTRDLRSSNLLDYSPEYITYPVNLLSDTFDKIFNSDTWQVVANFSAHKHVRSEKDKISVEALIKNNVFGAIKLLILCEVNPPKYFFSVSTDKAANPVNIMGASKSLMEKLILSKKNDFRVSTARFANVAFSNGSLLDGFIYRLNKKQPLSMKLFLPLFCIAFLLFSCSGSDSNFEPQTEADIIEYTEANNLNAQRSSSGLYYVINELGTGVRPTSNSNVTVAYRGTLLDGTVFDQSTNGISFGLNQVILGWREGITYFKEGGEGILLIPSNLGYGNSGSGSIPGGAVLVFDINLISVN